MISAPSRSASAISRSRRSGCIMSSLSRTASQRPRARSRARLRAAAGPPFTARTSTTTRGSASAKARARSRLSSVEASSTMITSIAARL